tara:strand:+ start:92 stop:397 length:306 start_codon:yes stop_codon:yes gene_type:complete
MQSAYDEIIDTYDKETMEEIANHGCSSGVCFKHIYYGDTIAFYDKYEDEIVDYIRTAYETDFLVKLFNEACADLDCYKNDVTWCYIEMIAFELTESLLQPV